MKRNRTTRSNVSCFAVGIDTAHLQEQLVKLKKDKVDMENTCDQETEFRVNKLTKEKCQLENDKHQLEAQLQHCPAHAQLVRDLTEEVTRLRHAAVQGELEETAKVLRAPGNLKRVLFFRGFLRRFLRNSGLPSIFIVLSGNLEAMSCESPS